MDTAQTDMTPEHQAATAGMLPGFVLLRGPGAFLTVTVTVRTRLLLRRG